MTARLEEFSEMEFDVLKEISNIGAGNATTAISTMLGIKVDMKVPVIKSIGKYINNSKMISGATILGDGEIALILDATTLV